MKFKQLNSFTMKLAYFLLIGYFMVMIQGMDDNNNNNKKIEMVAGQVKNGEVSINFSGNENNMITDALHNDNKDEVKKNNDLNINLLDKKDDYGDEGQNCLICLEKLKDGEKYTTVIDEIAFKNNREHVNLNTQQIQKKLNMVKQDHEKHFEFHELCMKDWMGVKLTCPMCRYEIQDVRTKEETEKMDKEAKARLTRERVGICGQCLRKFVKCMVINADRWIKAIFLPYLSTFDYCTLSNINMTSHLVFQFINEDYHRKVRWGISSAVMTAYIALKFNGSNSGPLSETTYLGLGGWVLLYEMMHALNSLEIGNGSCTGSLKYGIYFLNFQNLFIISGLHLAQDIWVASIMFLIQILGFDWNRKKMMLISLHIMYTGFSTSLLEKYEGEMGDGYGEMGFSFLSNHILILAAIRILSLYLSCKFPNYGI